MLANLALNRVLLGALALAGVFAALLILVEPVALIIVLNGVFIGAMVAITVAYHQLLIGSIIGHGEYNRVRQMALGIALGWAAIGLGAMNSIYIRTMDIDVPTTPLTAGVRFIAIIAAVMQITAPDFGQGLFYGRDRTVLWAAALLGAASGVLTMLVQWNGLFF